MHEVVSFLGNIDKHKYTMPFPHIYIANTRQSVLVLTYSTFFGNAIYQL